MTITKNELDAKAVLYTGENADEVAALAADGVATVEAVQEEGYDFPSVDVAYRGQTVRVRPGGCCVLETVATERGPRERFLAVDPADFERDYSVKRL